MHQLQKNTQTDVQIGLTSFPAVPVSQSDLVVFDMNMNMVLLKLRVPTLPLTLNLTIHVIQF